MPRIRFGPRSRFAWWIVTLVVLYFLSYVIRQLLNVAGQPRWIWFFVVNPILALIWYPTGYALDRLLTPRLSSMWRRN